MTLRFLRTILREEEMSIIQFIYKALKLAGPAIPFIAFLTLAACANPPIKTSGDRPHGYVANGWGMERGI